MKIFLPIVVGALIIGGFIVYSGDRDSRLGGSSDTFSGASVASKNIGATLTQALGQDARRKFISVQNHSAVPIFCVLDGATAAASSNVTSTATREVGFRIAATSTNNQGAYWSIQGYTGVVNCTASANTTSTWITSP